MSLPQFQVDEKEKRVKKTGYRWDDHCGRGKQVRAEGRTRKYLKFACLSHAR